MLASNPVVDPWVVSTAQTPNPLRYCASLVVAGGSAARIALHKRRNSNHFEVAAGGTSVALIARLSNLYGGEVYCR